MMWDLSDQGARLTAAHSGTLPDLFTLILSRDGKSRRLCRVAWRKKPHLGVRFVPQSEAARLSHLLAERQPPTSGLRYSRIP
jgi:PilZ domain-containing protein